MQETGWDLETIESQPFFVLSEILNDKRELHNPNNDVGPLSLTDFIQSGGISSIYEKGGK
ncbi:hypothetical protein FD03_GL002533 [Companilactobacillus nodensis DSM 19682 = JCM 14932 = NBRC 107160]|uniref:Uncharacterized protein n=1 Tax=Companilactobacillus nodensis DSM 19682 = JCM 14932 = NBRC 107160 TaxID=1423775 RepID=A0A0R1KBB6_9LACO|nr:hypothetical protein [Companilactobacillus nodensis]KRK78755.1 hypothetical protein FD03_GL002533 [Companilactobacillus nodensis DSM 19682 = JCM 14932 = NBRC 107160]